MTLNTGTPDPVDPVFISYRQTDGTDIVSELAWLLRAAGIPVWRDRDDLPPGDTDARLAQAIADGISGGVLVTTPDMEKSRVVKTIEAPRLVALHEDHTDFVLAIVNGVQSPDGKTDYQAPDRLLDQKPGTLIGVDQQPPDRAGLLTHTKGLLWHRLKTQRSRVPDSPPTLRLSIQTRNVAQVYDRTGDELDIRLRQSTHPRLPSALGLSDLKDTIGLLPDALTRFGADRVRIRGGAHLSVAFALGAALPATRVGHMDVVDQGGQMWSSGSLATFANPVRVQVTRSHDDPKKTGRPTFVAAYVDLVPGKSDAAFDRFVQENTPHLRSWLHLTNVSEAPLDPSDAGTIAADLAAHLRDLSYANNNATVHVLLRCPFPIALLLARLTNTLTCVVYEWTTENSATEGPRPRFVPSLRVTASNPEGVIEQVLLDDDAQRH